MDRRPIRVPVLHVLMGVSGWILYFFESYQPVLIFAAILTVLALPRFIRGSWDKADAEITAKLQEPIQPSKRVAHALGNSETLLWETHGHPINMLPWWLGFLAWTAGAVFVGARFGEGPGLIMSGAGALVFCLKAYLWRHKRLCLTNRRIFAVHGLIGLREENMPLNKLTDETLKIPWHSAILAWLRIIKMQYGTLIVESAGQDQALSRTPFVPNAIQFNRTVLGRALPDQG